MCQYSFSLLCYSIYQAIACQPPILDPVVDCLLRRTDLGVVEAACRLICSITAKNSDTQARVLSDSRILSKILGGCFVCALLLSSFVSCIYISAPSLCTRIDHYGGRSEQSPHGLGSCWRDVGTVRPRHEQSSAAV